MKRSVLLLATILFAAFDAFGQVAIKLPHESPTPSPWTHPEREYFTEAWGSRALTNVSTPSLLAFRPDPAKSNGAAVIIAPGGGFYALSIESEGIKVAEQLNARGFTAFVLKYRLVPTGEDGVAELIAMLAHDNQERIRYTRKFLSYSTADALAAIGHVRANAGAYDIDPNRIGMMGFSAGGVVLFGVVNAATEELQPDFVVPVYPGLDLTAPKPTRESPPALFLCAADDIPPAAIAKPVAAWHAAGVPVGLHLFPRGGHGFVARRQGLTTDHWLDRFEEWAFALGFVN